MLLWYFTIFFSLYVANASDPINRKLTELTFHKGHKIKNFPELQCKGDLCLETKVDYFICKKLVNPHDIDWDCTGYYNTKHYPKEAKEVTNCKKKVECDDYNQDCRLIYTCYSDMNGSFLSILAVVMFGPLLCLFFLVFLIFCFFPLLIFCRACCAFSACCCCAA